MPTLFNHTINPQPGQPYEKAYELITSGAEYGARVYATADPEDIVQLPPSLEAELPYAQDHYERAGLETTDNVIFNAGLGVSLFMPDHEWSIYAFDQRAHAMRPDESRLAAIALSGGKNSFIELAKDLGAPIPYTETYEAGQEPKLGAFEEGDLRYYKVNNGTQGAGIVATRSHARLTAVAEEMKVDYQVQAAVEHAKWLSVQYHSKDGEAIYLGTTEQIMDGTKHIGNKYPVNHEAEAREATDELAHYLAQQGMQGQNGFDVVLTPEGALNIENNARPTWAGYMMEIAKKAKAQEWHAQTLHTPFTSLSQFDLGDLTYDPQTKSGILLGNWGTLATHSEVGLIFAGPRQIRDQHMGLAMDIVKQSRTHETDVITEKLDTIS